MSSRRARRSSSWPSEHRDAAAASAGRDRYRAQRRSGIATTTHRHPHEQRFQAVSIHRESPALWRVTFHHPPINLVDVGTLFELHDLVSEIEASQEVKVVVFDSADADFFLAHWDVSSATRTSRHETPAPSWIELSLRLARTPAVSIALIRGRARGMGSEIALGFDMRFASIERAILGQPEVGVGLVPGGGAMERRPLLVGRARDTRDRAGGR